MHVAVVEIQPSIRWDRYQKSSRVCVTTLLERHLSFTIYSSWLWLWKLCFTRQLHWAKATTALISTSHRIIETFSLEKTSKIVPPVLSVLMKPQGLQKDPVLNGNPISLLSSNLGVRDTMYGHDAFQTVLLLLFQAAHDTLFAHT